MNISTSQKIIEYIKKKEQATAHELVIFLEISQRAVFKQLKKMIESKKLSKIGKSPKVYYKITEPINKTIIEKINIAPNIKKYIQENYLIVTPYGNIYESLNGFRYWCNKNKLDINKTAVEYYQTSKKYHQYYKNGLINGITKLKQSFAEVYLDYLYYINFYSIERFGKTKLGFLLLYAKQTQNRTQDKKMVKLFNNKILEIIKIHKINAICFIPPTIKREIQLMKEIEQNLNINLPKISIEKIKTPIIVAQKSLRKISDRIENIERTIIIDGNLYWKNYWISYNWKL